MADALSQMASTFHAGDVGIASPTRRTKAVQAVTTDKSLSQGDQVKAIHLFTQNIALCDSYLAINDADLRNAFLTHYINSD